MPDPLIETRFTRAFGVTCPIVSAPMAVAAGGALAAAVGRAGGLGLIGGGYCDADWIAAQFDVAGDVPVGCGLITWALAKHEEVLEQVLDRDPAGVFLSFGNPAPFAPRILDRGVPLICQVQTLRDARHAADIGATVIVAQGSEAGGHGAARAMSTLVPEVADMLAREHAETLLLAAGGIGDGRGLAAALMLGADGVLVGSRFWASAEALVSPAMHQAALSATGDQTIRSNVMDVARRLDWPARYNCRVLRNGFTDRWHDNPEGLAAQVDIEGARWRQGWNAGDPELSNTFVGEVTGLIARIAPAQEIIAGMMAEAGRLLGGGWRKV